MSIDVFAVLPWVVISLLAVVVLVLILIQYRYLRQVLQVSSSRKRAQELLDEARRELQEARVQAQKIISQAEAEHAEVEESFKTRITKISSDFLQAYEKHLSELGGIAYKQIDTSVAAIDTELKSELQEIKDAMRTTLAAEIDRVEAELVQSYQLVRERQAQQLAVQVQQVVGTVAGHVLHHTLDMAAHQQLIDEALDKALMEGIWEHHA